ncbi:hypothetical protein ABTE26_20800, partial [Acinetobacter baumannii]
SAVSAHSFPPQEIETPAAAPALKRLFPAMTITYPQEILPVAQMFANFAIRIIPGVLAGNQLSRKLAFVTIVTTAASLYLR